MPTKFQDSPTLTLMPGGPSGCQPTKPSPQRQSTQDGAHSSSGHHTQSLDAVRNQRP
ncbi:hypothetical protein LXT21_17120 [Myxococcus sp. K38C18041901]|nr:hypothetical protein [Myxococcus guangdongensis]